VKGDQGHPRRLRISSPCLWATIRHRHSKGRGHRCCDAIHSFYRRRQFLRPAPRTFRQAAATTLAHRPVTADYGAEVTVAKVASSAARDSLSIRKARSSGCLRNPAICTARPAIDGPPVARQKLAPENMTRSTARFKIPHHRFIPRQTERRRSIGTPLPDLPSDHGSRSAANCAKAGA